MLILRNISFLHPNKDLLFENINLTINQNDKIALVGNNGSGKSTLLKIIAGELRPAGGELKVDTRPYYVPQVFGQHNDLNIAQALGIEQKLIALNEILNGNVSGKNFEALDDDWTIEERCAAALRSWQLEDLNLFQKMDTLSGGQKTKIFLAGISIHQPKLVLLDEPGNHLDSKSRQQLYNFIQGSTAAIIVVSHDRKLLNLLPVLCELGQHGITSYGGNYDFYAAQKEIEKKSLSQDIQNKEKALRKAKEKERKTIERQQKLDARGKGKQEKAGVARIMMNTLRNSAENSTSKLKGIHAEKTGSIAGELKDLRSATPDIDSMKLGLDNSNLHKGKVLFSAASINYGYGDKPLWKESLDLIITSGERVAIKGMNGSGKTTLIKIIMGDLSPASGNFFRAANKVVHIDQDYSLIDNKLKVYEQAQQFNTEGLEEHEIKTRLSRFLFTKEDWDKPCSVLSGGERMRLILCCLTITTQSPDIIILDEPTNNLDIQNIEILTAAISNYQGTLIVVSHDEYFLEQINIERTIELE